MMLNSVRVQFAAFVTYAILLLAATSAEAQEIDRIIAFGDSWTANCCSNGPTWAVHVASSLGIPLTNRAVGGATSAEILTQVRQYLQSNTVDPEAVYIYWNIGNDFLEPGGLSDIPGTVSTIAANMSTTLTLLKQAGATHIMVFNNVDGSLVPRAISGNIEQLARSISDQQNASTLAVLDSLDLQDSLFDVFTLFNQIILDPRFTNVTQGCQTIGCSNPDRFVWWDENHPTAETHRLIAAGVVEEVNNRFASVPVPPPNPPSNLLVQ